MNLSRRGNVLRRWKDSVKEYIIEGSACRGKDFNKQRGSFWIGRDDGFSPTATPSDIAPEGSIVYSIREYRIIDISSIEINCVSYFNILLLIMF